MPTQVQKEIGWMDGLPNPKTRTPSHCFEIEANIAKPIHEDGQRLQNMAKEMKIQ
jgi:hypothetical protein